MYSLLREGLNTLSFSLCRRTLRKTKGGYSRYEPNGEAVDFGWRCADYIGSDLAIGGQAFAIPRTFARGHRDRERKLQVLLSNCYVYCDQRGWIVVIIRISLVSVNYKQKYRQDRAASPIRIVLPGCEMIMRMD
jgi:hypothetical protein